MNTNQADALRAVITGTAVSNEVQTLRGALDDFTRGGAGGPGLATSLRDLQSARSVIEDSIFQLETAGSAANIAGLIGNLSGALGTSLDVVKNLAGPLGP